MLDTSEFMTDHIRGMIGLDDDFRICRESGVQFSTSSKDLGENPITQIVMRVATIPIITGFVITLLFNNIRFRLLVIDLEDLLKVYKIIIRTSEMKIPWRRVNRKLRGATIEELKGGEVGRFVR